MESLRRFHLAGIGFGAGSTAMEPEPRRISLAVDFVPILLDLVGETPDSPPERRSEPRS